MSNSLMHSEDRNLSLNHRVKRPQRSAVPRLERRLAIALIGSCTACASHERGPGSAERAANVAVDVAASSLVPGASSGAGATRNGSRHRATVDVEVLGAMNCLTLPKYDLILRIIDEIDGSVVTHGLRLRDEWRFVGDLDLLKGRHRFEVVVSSQYNGPSFLDRRTRKSVA